MAAQGVNASVENLRNAVIGQSQQAAEAIERAADTISFQSTSPAVRTNALEWKLVSSVELQSAALRRDPAVALADLILFSLQMRAYLTTGEGKDLFGSLQPFAVGAINRSLTRELAMVDQVTPPGTSARWMAIMEPFATAHPILHPYLGRVAVTDSIGPQLDIDRSALAAVGDIELTVRLLDRRIEQVQRSLLKQARWQAELVMVDAAKQPTVDTLMRDVNRLTSSVERITGVTEELPDLLTHERIATMQQISGERIAVLAGITAERQALMEQITGERLAVIEALHEERIATLKDAEASAQRLIDYTLDQRLSIFINHVLWRLFLGLALMLLLAFGLALVVVSVWRRQGRLFRT